MGRIVLRVPGILAGYELNLESEIDYEWINVGCV